MERTEKKHRYGLLGRNISYSFSKGYFTRFFREEGLTHCSYENFDLKEISDLETLLKEEQDLRGLSVTIPYKKEIISYLHRLHPDAREIGAVNTVKFTKTGLEGYNTDTYGFRKSLEPFLESNKYRKTLILGMAIIAAATSCTLNGDDGTTVTRAETLSDHVTFYGAGKVARRQQQMDSSLQYLGPLFFAEIFISSNKI